MRPVLVSGAVVGGALALAACALGSTASHLWHVHWREAIRENESAANPVAASVNVSTVILDASGGLKFRLSVSNRSTSNIRIGHADIYLGEPGDSGFRVPAHGSPAFPVVVKPGRTWNGYVLRRDFSAYIRKQRLCKPTSTQWLTFALRLTPWKLFSPDAGPGVTAAPGTAVDWQIGHRVLLPHAEVIGLTC